MPSETIDEPAFVATEQLEALGLSGYAARALVALFGLGDATAREVSESAEIPRTRVYDAMEELEERGFVNVKHVSPRRFWAVSAETTTRRFEELYDHRLARLGEALDAIDAHQLPTQQSGVWTVTGREAVTDRLNEFIDSATEEIVFMTVGELLTESIIDRLAAANDRGVSIKLAEMAGKTESDLQGRLPEAEFFESLWAWSDAPAGRVLLADRARTLASVLTRGDGENLEDPRDETAIWGSGANNSLVVLLKGMFAWRLDN